MSPPQNPTNVSTEWAKHLRPYLKRQFHKRVRKIARRLARADPENTPVVPKTPKSARDCTNQ